MIHNISEIFGMVFFAGLILALFVLGLMGIAGMFLNIYRRLKGLRTKKWNLADLVGIQSQVLPLYVLIVENTTDEEVDLLIQSLVVLSLDLFVLELVSMPCQNFSRHLKPLVLNSKCYIVNKTILD